MNDAKGFLWALLAFALAAVLFLTCLPRVEPRGPLRRTKTKVGR
jgi:hypothetical protein